MTSMSLEEGVEGFCNDSTDPFVTKNVTFGGEVLKIAKFG